MHKVLNQGYNPEYNITFNPGGLLDIKTPSNKHILLLDGEFVTIHNNDYGRVIDGEFYPPNSSAYNRSFRDVVTYGIGGKISSIEKILPRTISPEESKIRDEFNNIWMRDGYRDMTRQEKRKIKREYEAKLYKYSTHRAEWRKVTFHQDNEMSMECFNAILEHCGNPDYIIVSNDFVYEHLPLDGKPKDIHTSEGIIEAWEINGVTIFYMPLRGNMSNEDIILWHNVLTEIFK